MGLEMRRARANPQSTMPPRRSAFWNCWISRLRKGTRNGTERGCPKLNLQVLSAKADIRAFYEALGYRADAVISLGKRLGEFADAVPAA